MNSDAPPRPRRVLPPVYFFLTIVVMILLHELWPIARWLERPWTWLGILPVVLGVGVAVAGRLLFHRHDTTVKPGEVSSALVTGGPFRMTRNPMYFGMMATVLGVAVMCGTVSPLLPLPLFWWIIDRRFVRMEEAMLENTFGESYVAYKRRVRRWL